VGFGVVVQFDIGYRLQTAGGSFRRWLSPAGGRWFISTMVIACRGVVVHFDKGYRLQAGSYRKSELCFGRSVLCFRVGACLQAIIGIEMNHNRPAGDYISSPLLTVGTKIFPAA
jgi:hypothetical protein